MCTPYHEAEIEFATKPNLRRCPQLQQMGEIEANGIQHLGDERCTSCIKHSQPCFTSSSNTPGISTARCTFCMYKKCPCSFVAESKRVHAACQTSGRSSPRQAISEPPPRPLPSCSKTRKRKRSFIDPASWPKAATEALLDFLDEHGPKTLLKNKFQRLDNTLRRAKHYLNNHPGLVGQTYKFNVVDVEKQLSFLCKRFGVTDGLRPDRRALIKGGRKRTLKRHVPESPVPEIPAIPGVANDSDLPGVASSTQPQSPRATLALSDSSEDGATPQTGPGSSDSRHDAQNPMIMVANTFDHVEITQSVSSKPPKMPRYIRSTLPPPGPSVQAKDTSRTQQSETKVFFPSHHPHPRSDTIRAPGRLRSTIRNAVLCLFSSLPSLKTTPPPDYNIIEKEHPTLYALLQHTFGTRGQDSAALTARLAELNLQTISAVEPIRAIIAVAIHTWILESDFPESCAPEKQGVLWRTMEAMVTHKQGKKAWTELHSDVLSATLRAPSFLPSVIEPRAAELALRLSTTLSPLLPNIPELIHTTWLVRLRKLLTEALQFKVMMALDPDRLELHWPAPCAPFDRFAMEADPMSEPRPEGEEDTKVWFGLMPAVLAFPEDEEDPDTGEGADGVLVKALVMV